MSNPTVCAVCLVNGRPEMVTRAIRSFQSQTYSGAWLLIYDTSEQSLAFNPPKGARWRIPQLDVKAFAGMSIGNLRNMANRYASHHYAASSERPEIFVHFDSDDVSHPNRITEQVALLQASGKECVGYRDMIFWRTEINKLAPGSTLRGRVPVTLMPDNESGAAWLYTNGQRDYCLGTSLCYWRSVWEKRPFEDLPKGPMGMGEDHQWLQGVNALGVTSEVIPPIRPYGNDFDYGQRYPRMIASVHGGNSTDIMKVAIQVKDKMLRRAPEWDKYCAEAMKL